MARRACLAVVALLLLLRGPLLFKHAFDPDEFQHLHSAFCVGQGLVPYRDYFDHHAPWLHLLVAPALRAARVEQDPERAVAAVFAARALMWVLSGAIVWLTFRLGAAWRGKATGLAGAALLSLIVLFPDKTLEFRPDVPACAALLGCWVLALEGQRPLLAGLLAGAALLFTPKALFALPAVAFLIALSGARAVTVFALGAAAPVAATAAGFAAAGALRDFVTDTLFVNVAWKTRFSPLPVLRGLAEDNTAIVLLAIVGVWLSLRRVFEKRCRRDAFIVAQTLLLLGGGFVIPIPYAQYFVPLLPLIALLAADAAYVLSEGLPEPRRGPAWAVALVLLAIGPLLVAARILAPDNTRVADKLRKLRYAMSLAGPGEPLLDGFSGLGVFRPHAFRFFFLHDEMRAQLAAQDVAQLVNGLRDGAIAPSLVAADADLLAVSPELGAFLRENFEPTSEAPLLRPRELAYQPGRGWRVPEHDGELAFRRSRGSFATLRVGARAAGPARLELFVRAAPGTSAVVLVNGAAAGQLPLSDAWREAAIDCTLRAGVNGVRLELAADSGTPELALARLRVAP